MTALGWLVIGVVIVAAAVAAVGWVFSVLRAVGEEVVQASKAAGTETLAGTQTVTKWLLRKYVDVSTTSQVSDLTQTLDAVEREVAQIKRWKPRWKRAPENSRAQFASALPVYARFFLPSPRAGKTEFNIEEVRLLRTPSSEQVGKAIEKLARDNCRLPSTTRLSVYEIDEDYQPPNVSAPLDVRVDDASIVFHAQSKSLRKILIKLFSQEIRQVDELNDRIRAIRERAEKVGRQYAVARNRALEQLDAAREEAREETEARKALLEEARRKYLEECRAESAFFSGLTEGYKARTVEGVCEYFRIAALMIELPGFLPKEVVVGYDPAARVMVVDVRLPNLPDLNVKKSVRLKSGDVEKPLNKKERSQVLSELHPLQLIRIGQELALADVDGVVNGLAINGWVQYSDRATGKTKRGYVACVMASPDQFRDIDIRLIDPMMAFQKLRGVSAFVTDDVVPIKPTLALDHNDPRFVEGREVLSSVGADTNLAAMDWQDFEHLIRQLFERLFAGVGTEVHVTQASRDKGVDAVVLDPDPIRGGKTVIQAKRYSNTVDVAAVRDLYGAVMNEGASRGILVTTSSFGADAYEFVKDKPLTLINGSGLLSYLKDMGFAARIDLEEARRLNQLSY